MDDGHRERESQLFTLRLWQEGLGDGRKEWRSRVRHVPSGETRHFRDWDALRAYLCAKVNAPEAVGARATGEPV
jgi:hypothetical protein